MLLRRLTTVLALACMPLAAGPKEFGIAEFQAAVEARGLRPETFRLRYELNTEAPESWQISGVRISGGDMRGLMYGLLEAADQIAATGRLRPAHGSPVFAVRGVRLHLTDPPQIAGQDSWRPFFEMLARARFNRVRLLLDNPSRQEGMVKALSELAAEFGIDVLPRVWRPAIPEAADTSAPVYEVGLGEGATDLPWGDPAYAQRIVADARQKGYDAIEVESSLAYKSQWLALLVWGRAMFNPDSLPKVLEPEFERRFGKAAAPVMEEAYSLASRALSLSDDGNPGPELDGLALAQAYHEAALAAGNALDRAAKMFSPDHAEWKAAEPGLRRLVTLGRFHGRLASAEEMLELFRASGNDAALRSARQNFGAAARLAGELKLPFSPPDLAGETASDFGPLSYPPPLPKPEFQHQPPKELDYGQSASLRLRVAPAGAVEKVVVHYRELPDEAEFRTLELAPGESAFQLKPTADLQYYFEVVNRQGDSWYDPDPLGAAPYYFIPVGSPPAQ